MLDTLSALTERMTLFWHNYFTLGQDKFRDPQLMARQILLLRRHAPGIFGELLHDIAKDSAMLRYLDGASNRRGKPNENFAREVTELFTPGEGRYTQRDVAESGRAYGGWTLDPDTQANECRANQHDGGENTVLGQTGALDGDPVLDILLARPETATFVTTKLGASSSPTRRIRRASSRPPRGFARSATTSRWRCMGSSLTTHSGAMTIAACW